MKLYEIECACKRFERLEGAGIQAYITQFLEQAGVDEESQKTYYYCRVCGAPWVGTEANGQNRSSLVQLKSDYNV